MIDFYPLPHYTDFPFAEVVEKIISEFGNKLNVCPISNSQVICVKGEDLIVESL